MNNQNSLNLAKLTYLLQNSRLFSMKPGTFPVVYNKINTKLTKLANLLSQNQLGNQSQVDNLLEKSHSSQVSQKFVNWDPSKLKQLEDTHFPIYHQRSWSTKQSTDLSKDFALYFSLIKKPINLIFSIDQLLYEFSKKSFQQKKTGEFLQQLKERKKLSLFYGHLTRKQLVNLFNKVENNKGFLSKNLFSMLERRLDVVLYRSGFLKTITQARQLVKHQKVFVNSNLVDIPSFLVNPGDVISFAPDIFQALSDEFFKSIDSQNLERLSLVEKNQSQIFGDFYSKLADFKFKEPANGSERADKKTNSLNFNLFCCDLIIKLLCTKIKSSCFYNLKKSSTYSELGLLFPNFPISRSHKSLQDIYLLQLKWNFFSPNKNFSNGEKSLFSTQKHNNQQAIYANFSFLQKKPEFWNSSCYGFQNTSSFGPKTSWNTFAKTADSSPEFLQKGKQQKNIKFFDEQRQNLQLFQKSFLFFFKCLEKHSKFQNLLTLMLKKSFFKRCRLSQMEINVENVIPNYSKILKFKATKPLHIEISYNLLNLIYLFSPQRVNFPFYVDFDLIKRSLH